MNKQKDHKRIVKNRMHHRQLQSKYSLIRYYALQTVKTLPIQEQHKKLLEQQIAELIQNAVVHGNKSREELTINVWHTFKKNIFTIIIEDEGMGFTELEHWTQWNQKRTECLAGNNHEEFQLYASYQKRGSFTPEYFGGTGLFTAIEYWNGGFSFSQERNMVTASKIFYPTFIEEENELD